MIPTEAHLDAIAALLALDDGEDHRGWLRERFAEDPARLRVALSSAGVARAFLRVFTPAPDRHWLTAPRFGPDGAEATAGLLAEAVALARARGWATLSTRVDPDAQPAAYRAALAEHGFAAVNTRVEYKTPVVDLPAEGESPFEWRPLDVVGEAAAAALIERAGPGPEWEADDTGAAVLAHALDRRGMYCAPDCVQVGLLDGAPAAFVIAQVQPATGWSTITFMGLAPEVRGRGLGQHVHRRGMAMLRAQGGVQYHGGTSTSNQPMVRLFERHGCLPFARLVEYVATI